MKKVILAILDGVGHRGDLNGNAVKNATIPNFNKLLSEYPHSLLNASGTYVGLPEGQVGNSEVGHLTIGAGRTIKQSLEIVNESIETGTIYMNPVIKEACNHSKENKSKLHIIGLLSDGGVHSHIDHILTLIDIAKMNHIKDLYIHVILDGRDTLPKSAMKYLDILNEKLNKEKIGKIATISGRYYTMDRERCWDRTKLAYDALINGKGPVYNSYSSLIKDSYDKGITDEFIVPSILDRDGMIEENDSLLIANFRSDRLVQLLEPICNDDTFKEFEVKDFSNVSVYTMSYVKEDLFTNIIFDKINVQNSLTEILSNNNIKTLRVAETSKAAHITHFIDGDKDITLNNTFTKIIPKIDVATYDLEPQMSAKEITDYIEDNIKEYDFILVNYANGDMVGHTGNYKAAIKSMEYLDKEIKRLYDISKKNNFLLILTADHGNLEEMIDDEGRILTSHTNNRVYFIVCDNEYDLYDGSLSDIAPTILDLYDIDAPHEMTGANLISETL